MGSIISDSLLSILSHYTYLTMIPLFLSIAQLHAYPGTLLIETIGGASTPSDYTTVSCPKEVPRSNSECNTNGVERELSCEYGEECCCGKCWPSLEAHCWDGRWALMYTDMCMHGESGCNL